MGSSKYTKANSFCYCDEVSGGAVGIVLVVLMAVAVVALLRRKGAGLS